MIRVSLVESDSGVRVHVPMTFRNRSGRKEIVVPDGLENAEDSAPDYHEALVIAISRAHRWKRMLDEGRYGSVAELAQAVKVNRHYLARLLRLTLLAPNIIETILGGQESDGTSLSKLYHPVPALWADQESVLAISPPSQTDAAL